MPAATTSVLFLAPEPVQPNLSGPCRRAIELAKVVAQHCEVTVAAPSPSQFPDLPFRTVSTGPVDDQRLDEVVRGHDVLVTQALPSPRQLWAAAQHSARLVIDLIAPFAFEALELKHRTDAGRRAALRWRARELVEHLARADLVLCTNERQRDLLLGTALAAGLLADDSQRELPAHRRFAVVPYGMPETSPRPTQPVLRGVGPIGLDDPLVVWGGGIWSWFDALTPIKAIERLEGRKPNMKLLFLGSGVPDSAVGSAHEEAARQAVAYSRERGLEGRSVIFQPQWRPHDEFVECLLEADVGISTNPDTLEAHFSTRTRILDYLHAGLPVVATRGDVMADFIETNDLGRAIEAFDVDGCAAAFLKLTQNRPRVQDRSALSHFYWENVAEPLVEFCSHPPPPSPRRPLVSGASTARQYATFVRAMYHEGTPADFARALIKRPFRRLRRI